MPTIEKHRFLLAFEHSHDGSFGPAQSAFLDRSTGEVFWLYKDDEAGWDEVGMPPEENRAGWDRVLADRGRFLEIEPLDYLDRRDILGRFLRSNWTDDDARRRRAREAYSGAIGRWKRDVRDGEAVRAYLAYQDQEALEQAEEFLRENGVEPKWS